MPARRRSQIAGAVLAAVVAAAVPVSLRWATDGAGPGAAGLGWQATWRTAPEPPAPTGPSHDGFANKTVRMIVHPTVGGEALRVRVSNVYGQRSLTVGKVAVAEQQTGPVVVARTQRTVTFDGSQTAVIPAGAEAVSDPVPMNTHRGRNLVVSAYLPEATGPTTWHAFAQATTYLSTAGDWASEPGGSPYQSIASSWFFLDGVDVLTRPLDGTVVAFGDSITDGRFSTIDADHTYPDWLARRIGNDAVLNEGIGGNQILADSPAGGDAAVHRFQRDAVEQLGVTAIVFLEGVNDIGKGATTQQLIDAMTQLIEQAHARCIAIIGATITPFKNSVYDTPAHEQTREAVNAWIRTGGAFDGVADFDKAIRDPGDPLSIDPRYHTVGDLHPNDVGYAAMADAVDPSLLTSRPGCTRG